MLWVGGCLDSQGASVLRRSFQRQNGEWYKKKRERKLNGRRVPDLEDETRAGNAREGPPRGHEKEVLYIWLDEYPL